MASGLRTHRARIEQALGDRIRLIEHIGSTAVPGLAAKPIIDVVVAVDDPTTRAPTSTTW